MAIPLSSIKKRLGGVGSCVSVVISLSAKAIGPGLDSLL